MDTLKPLLKELKKNKKTQYAAIGGASAVLLLLGKLWFNGGKNRATQDLTGKIAIVTGANTGIGAETARVLASKGAAVVLACRDEARTKAVIDRILKDQKDAKVEFMKLDLSDLESVREFTNQFRAKYDSLHILINNAGVMAIPTWTATKQGFEMQLGTNHLGHFVLTHRLLDLLKKSQPSRIINLSSKGHTFAKGINFDDLRYTKDYNPWIVYGQSKLANVLHAKELQKRFDEEGVKVKAFSVHPGAVKTELLRNYKQGFFKNILYYSFYPLLWYTTKSPLQGAQTSLYCALEDFDKLKGGAYHADCKEAKTSKSGTDIEQALKLYSETEKLVAPFLTDPVPN